MRREQGSALISAIVASGIVMTLGMTALAVSVHTNDVSGQDRSRTQALHAADAAISEVLQRFSTDFNNVGACTPANSQTASPPVQLNDSGSRIARFRFRVEPAPADPGYPNTCTTNQRVVRAWGYDPVLKKAVRQLEVGATVTPISGFTHALFAGGAPGSLVLKNNAVVDGSVYAQTFSSQYNELTLNSGDLTSPGSIVTMNNGSYGGNIAAGGSITLGENNVIGGSVRAALSGSGVTIGNNSRADRMITAGGAVSPWPCPAPNVCAQNTPSSPPATVPLPTFQFDPLNYPNAPPIVFTSAAAANAFFATPLPSGIAGVFYITDPSPSEKVLNLTTPWKIVGPLTIIADKCVVCPYAPKIKITGTTWTSTCAPSCQFVLVSSNTSLDAIKVVSPQLTLPTNLSALFYSPGGIDVSFQINTYVGSMYASSIEGKNNMRVEHSADLANRPPPGFTFPGAGVKQWTVQYSNWREVAPGVLPLGS